MRLRFGRRLFRFQIDCSLLLLMLTILCLRSKHFSRICRHIHGPRRRWRWLEWIFTLHKSVTRGWKCKCNLQLQLPRTSTTSIVFLFLLFASAKYIMGWAVNADDGDLCSDLFLKLLDAVWKRCRMPDAQSKWKWILNVPNGLWNAKLCKYYKWYMSQWGKACLRHEEVRQLSWDCNVAIFMF